MPAQHPGLAEVAAERGQPVVPVVVAGQRDHRRELATARRPARRRGAQHLVEPVLVGSGRGDRVDLVAAEHQQVGLRPAGRRTAAGSGSGPAATARPARARPGSTRWRRWRRSRRRCRPRSRPTRRAAVRRRGAGRTRAGCWPSPPACRRSGRRSRPAPRRPRSGTSCRTDSQRTAAHPVAGALDRAHQRADGVVLQLRDAGRQRHGATSPARCAAAGCPPAHRIGRVGVMHWPCGPRA